MTQVCQVCTHEDRKRIDREIARGGNLSEIAKKYQLSYNSVWRHSREHLPGAAARGAVRSFENHGVKLLEDLDDLVATARRILREAEGDGHRRTALAAVKETRSTIESIARIQHAIWQQTQQQQTIVEVQQQQDSPQWIRDGFKTLTPAERQQYKRLCIKILSGTDTSNETEPEDTDPIQAHTGDFTPEVIPEDHSGEKSLKHPLVQGKKPKGNRIRRSKPPAGDSSG